MFLLASQTLHQIETAFLEALMWVFVSTRAFFGTTDQQSLKRNCSNNCFINPKEVDELFTHTASLRLKGMLSL